MRQILQRSKQVLVAAGVFLLATALTTAVMAKPPKRPRRPAKVRGLTSATKTIARGAKVTVLRTKTIRGRIAKPMVFIYIPRNFRAPTTLMSPPLRLSRSSWPVDLRTR